MRRQRARAEETAVDVHARDALHGGCVDAAADRLVDRAADHDEAQVGAPQHRRGDVDRIGRDGELGVLGQIFDERESGAAAIEEQQLAALDQRCGRARERRLALACRVDAGRHRRARRRDGQRAAVDAAAAALGGERAQIAPDRVFGDMEFGGERGGLHRLPEGEPAGDCVASCKWNGIVHARSITCMNKN